MSILEVVIVGSLVAAGACLVFAFFALFRDKALENADKTAQEINKVAVEAAKNAAAAPSADAAGLAAQNQAHAALSGGLSDYIKALAELAGNVSKLRQGVAGLFMAFAFLGLAGGLAAVEDKVPDKAKTTTVTAPTK